MLPLEYYLLSSALTLTKKWRNEVYCTNASVTAKKNFIVTRDLVYFATCFGQFDHLQVIHTMYEILGRKIIRIKYCKKEKIS